MAQRKSVRLKNEQLDILSDMDERDMADNESEALRMLLDAGAREYGYENGRQTDTTLKTVVSQAAWLFTVAGLVGLAFTFAYPVPARIPSFAVASVGVVLVGVSRLLEDHEPGVSNRLKQLFGGETA